MKLALSIALVICSIASIAVVTVSGSAMATIPFVVLFFAASAIAVTMGDE